MFQSMKDLLKQMKRNKIDAGDMKKVKMPKELVDQLKTLGYIE